MLNLASIPLFMLYPLHLYMRVEIVEFYKWTVPKPNYHFQICLDVIKMSKQDPEESSTSSDTYDTSIASPQVDPTPTTYITLETTDGQLEHVKV